jgi:hypothetical protein
MKSYTTLRNQFGTLSQNSTSANLLLGDQLINDSLRYLQSRFFQNEASYVLPGGTVAGTNVFSVPFNVKDIIDVTITVGTIRYTLTEAPTRKFWDKLNVVPYQSDVPQFFFRYANAINIFPIPASSSNVVTVNYKQRIKDLSQADYAVGTVTVTNASATVTGAGTTWGSFYNGCWLRIPEPGGDGEWYQIQTAAATSVTLFNVYNGVSGSGLSYTVGEMPTLPEDYHDLAVYRGLYVYFTTRVPDPNRAELFKGMYDEGYARLNAEFGSKTSSVAISDGIEDVTNPNLFLIQGT